MLIKTVGFIGAHTAELHKTMERTFRNFVTMDRHVETKDLEDAFRDADVFLIVVERHIDDFYLKLIGRIIREAAKTNKKVAAYCPEDVNFYQDGRVAFIRDFLLLSGVDVYDDIDDAKMALED